MKSPFTVIFVAVLACSLLFVASVLAVGPGKVMEWDPAGSPGKVSIDGKVHADRGVKCMECHTKIWPMKKGTDMTMADMDAGKYCGVCHTGEKAFSTKDQANCTKCHQSQK